MMPFGVACLHKLQSAFAPANKQRGPEGIFHTHAKQGLPADRAG